jgi:hypothetical protein
MTDEAIKVVGEVKCYHCGHVSGEIEGTRTDRLVLHAFKPRPGYRGTPPGPGDRIRCERCAGPVFVEDLRPLPMYPLVVDQRAAKKRPSRRKAA